MSEEKSQSPTPETADASGEVDAVRPVAAESAVPTIEPIRLIVIAAVVALGGYYGYHSWQYGSTHAVTDDAYVTTDVVPANSTIAGSVAEILVKDNQHVKAGELLVRLDDAARQAEVEQAEANLAAAKAAAGGASVDVQMAEQTGFAQVSQAQQAIEIGSSDIALAQANVMKASSGIATAEANIAKSKADVLAASAVVDSRRSTAKRTREQLVSLRAMVASAESNLKAAQSNLVSAQAVSNNAERDAKRAEELAEEGATAAASAEAKETAAATAKAAVETARQQVEVARSLVAQRKADLSAAEEQIREAEAGVTQAQAQLVALNNTVNATQAQKREAQSGLSAAKQAVSAANLRRSQAEGKLRETEASQKRVGLSENNRLGALAKIKLAAAALRNAQINLNNTRIKALVSGVVSMRTVQLGQQVAPGQQMMAIIPAAEPWVVANFKETQLTDIHPGQNVEIEIDALPGFKYKAHVDSISRGTGATFALLPPDNATGNFTKVVQRVPVKIVFESNQPNLDKLRAGLSSKVAVSLRG
jgi:membrane fusion protein (multidrug efflux system)